LKFSKKSLDSRAAGGCFRPKNLFLSDEFGHSLRSDRPAAGGMRRVAIASVRIRHDIMEIRSFVCISKPGEIIAHPWPTGVIIPVLVFI